MKKLLTLAVIATAFGLTSCKKDYTCSCTGAVTIDIPIKDAKKSDAKDACSAAQTTYSAAGSTTCTLK
jgi:hypothetical protein